MSVLPSAPEKTQGMDMGLELQERSAPLCWPHLNGTTHHNLQPPIGTAHHNLPPIAAITSCRPSSSPVLKTPKDVSTTSIVPSPLVSSPKQNTPQEETSYPTVSSPSVRERKEDHVFLNPPRPAPAVPRPPTPFPDNPHATNKVFQNAGLPPVRLEPRISPKLNNLSVNEPDSPSHPPASASVSESTPHIPTSENGSTTITENSNNVPDSESVEKLPQSLPNVLPSSNSNSESENNAQPASSSGNFSSVNQPPVSNVTHSAPEANSVSCPQVPLNTLEIATVVTDKQRTTPAAEHSSHTTTAYHASAATVTSTVSASIPNYTHSNAPPPPSLSQPHQEIRNYSNQSHRYFATSPAENSRPFPSPSPRNSLYINSFVNQSDSNANISRASPSIEPMRLGASHTNISDPSDYLQKMPSPSERKAAQVPHNENYRRFVNPAGKTSSIAIEGAPPLATQGERFSPQTSVYNQYRGSLPHAHIPERPTGHQDADGRNYPQTHAPRIPARHDANQPIQSDRNAHYYPPGNRNESGNVPPQDDRRPPYPPGATSSDPVHAFSSQNNRVTGYPPSPGARSYAPPQTDRSVLYNPAPTQASDALRSYVPPHHDKNSAVNTNARPPQTQNYNTNVNIEPEQPRNDRPTHIGPLNPYPPQGSAPSVSRPYGPLDKSYSSHVPQEKSFHHPERNLPNYPPNGPQNQRHVQYPQPSSGHALFAPPQPDKNNKYQQARTNYPSPNSLSHQPMKNQEPVAFTAQQSSRYGFQAYPSRSQLPPSISSSHTPASYVQSSRPAQDSHYYLPDAGRQPWTTSAGSSRSHEAMQTFMPRPAAHRAEVEKHAYPPQLPHGATAIPRNDNSYQHSGHSPMAPAGVSSRDRPQDNTNVNALPRINPPSVVSVSSSRSPRFSSHPSQRPIPYSHSSSSPSTNPPHSGATYSYPGQISTSVSSSFSSSLPRVNFPSPAVSSFNNVQPASSLSGYTRNNSGPMLQQRPPSPHVDSRHQQPREQPKSQPTGRPVYPYPTQQGSRPIPPSYNAAPQPQRPTMDAAMFRPNSSQYTPTRGHAMETDTCRNPFELPNPASQPRAATTSGGVIKSHYKAPSSSYSQKPSDSKGPAAGGFPPRSPYDNYPTNSYQSRSDVAVKHCDNSQAVHISYPALPPRTEQRPAGGNDDRQKPPQISARFPPVPQSNYDLQRQIFDRMTGVQQAPPKLMEKARTEPVRTEAPRQKRESPLDLSVKTVRQSADSTRDDIDLFSMRNSIIEARLPGPPKIDFNPNFAGPLVQRDVRGVAPLPPVQSIRKFSQPVAGNVPTPHRKRPTDEPQSSAASKVSKSDAWEIAIDEQIEEKLKAARMSRLPAAPLTPLHPPAQSVTPTNPELSQPPARPPYDSQQMRFDRYRIPEPSRTGHRGWNPGTYPTHAPGGPDPETLVQQISQGMMPDSRLLQDNNVIDMLRTSLEKKEARLNALQAATRRHPSGQPLDQFGAERMFTPPSYPHGHHRGAEPVPIDIEPTKNYGRGPGNDGDLDGLAAFLAARIRTKAEMKQMGPANASFRPPDFHVARAMVPGASPPKLHRDYRMPGNQQQRRVIMSPSNEEGGPLPPAPRDLAGLRSSSETSVFDFRESDSESEMPMLDGMRKPRKTLPRTDSEQQELPGPAPKPALLLEPDLAWDNACDMFVEQLQKRPIKRSVRKKKPNPKFYANELEAPPFLKVKTEEVEEEPVAADKPIETTPKINEEIKTDEPDDYEVNVPPLPIVLKEESSSGDEGLIGVTVVKEGRVKLVTKKQRPVVSDSEWGSSDVESSSLDSEVSSEDFDSDDDSEDSTARKMRKRDQSDSSSSEDAPRRRKGRRTRSRAISGSDDESDGSIAQAKTRRNRNVVKSDSEESEQSESKNKGRRTRAKALSDTDESDSNKKKTSRTRIRDDSETDGSSEPEQKKRGVKTRQTSKQSQPPARMRLRSKKRGATKGSSFRPGWEEDLIKFKQQLRMPDRLINVGKSKKRQGAIASPVDDEEQSADKEEKAVTKGTKKIKKEKKEDGEKSDESVKVSPKGKKSKKKDKDDKDDKGDDGNKDETKSTPASIVSKRRLVTRGKDGMLQKRSLRGSVGMRRSNKAVQNSKRHLNKGKKRLKLRRKFRSGFDYMRRKKKQGQRKEGEPTPTPVESKEPKRKERTEALDISAEIKSWVVNKSAGETVLHRAARLGYADAALYCLETLRLAPSPRDHAGYTPLHEACSRGHVAVANYLLQFGANVSESARGGVRPLHQAAENNHMELVRLLLAYGADPLLATYTGQTALSLAANDDVRELIQQHLADVQGEEAPKWHFDGPASVFDPSWAVDPLANPPSPDSVPLEVEMEVSEAMLPPLYRLLPNDGERCDPNERWMLLDELVNYTQDKSAEDVIASLPSTSKCEISDSDFKIRAVCCNILSAPSPSGPKVRLIRYDDSVRKLLDVEVFTISLGDQ